MNTEADDMSSPKSDAMPCPKQKKSQSSREAKDRMYGTFDIIKQLGILTIALKMLER